MLSDMPDESLERRDYEMEFNQMRMMIAAL
jgi:hypothetical protein